MNLGLFKKKFNDFFYKRFKVENNNLIEKIYSLH